MYLPRRGNVVTRSSTDATPHSSSCFALRGLTLSSTETGTSLNERNDRGDATPADLLQTQQVRVQRLAAVMHLERHLWILLTQPLAHLPRVPRLGPLALNERDQLVVRLQQPAQQQPGGHHGG